MAELGTDVSRARQYPAVGMGLRPEIAELTASSDLSERVARIPASARVRGVYFKSIRATLEEAGVLSRYLELFPERRGGVRWYPVAELLEHAVVGAALLEGPEGIDQGLRTIGRKNPMMFAESLLGKTMLRFLDRDPVRLLKQGSAARRQSCSYGRWELEVPEPGLAIMSMYEEYMWIESNLRGAAEGTFESVGRQVEVEVDLVSTFQGRHILRWDPSAVPAR